MRFVARAFALRGAELVTRAFAPRGAEERRDVNRAVVEVKLSKQVSDKCCFYMPAQWAVPYLQWAAGEKCAISEVKLSKRVASPPEVGMNRERERYRSIAILLS